MPPLLGYLWWLSVATAWFALIRLAIHRMYRFYPALFTYLAIVACSDCVLLLLDPTTMRYVWSWVAIESALLLARILVVWELVRLVCAGYRGIGNFARLLIVLAVGTAAILCIVTAPLELQAAPWTQRAYQLLLMAGRWTTTVLSGVVLLFTAFFAVYGHPGKLNLDRHRWITTIYLLGNSVLWFWAEMGDKIRAGGLRMLLSVACVFAWGWLLVPQGEEDKKPPSLGLDAVDRWNTELIAVGQRVLGSGREG